MGNLAHGAFKVAKDPVKSAVILSVSSASRQVIDACLECLFD